MSRQALVRAQTILYKNDLSMVERSVDSIANAVRISRERNGAVVYGEIAFGDASPEPIMSDQYIGSLNKKFGDDLKITYQFFNMNSGTSKGQNILLESCESPYLMIYNPDVVVSPTYFLEMMAVYGEENTDIGMVEARQTPLEHPKSYDLTTGEEIWGAMACVITPTAVYKELGGLAEKDFFMYCDDVDYSWRLRLSGRKVIYCPNAVVFHGHRLDENGHNIPTEAELYYSAESSLIMAYKWSNDKWLNKLIKICENGTVYQKKALAEFYRRKENGLLPVRLDGNHKIAYFKDGCYAKHRFM